MTYVFVSRWRDFSKKQKVKTGLGQYKPDSWCTKHIKAHLRTSNIVILEEEEFHSVMWGHTSFPRGDLSWLLGHTLHDYSTVFGKRNFLHISRTIFLISIFLKFKFVIILYKFSICLIVLKTQEGLLLKCMQQNHLCNFWRKNKTALSPII